MGMDVYGNSPIAEEGKYFRNSVWWWRPLADYIGEISPAIAGKCKYWQSNDGDGLNAEDAIALAEALEIELAAGRTTAYEKVRTSTQEMMPNEKCFVCAGTGVRLPIPNCGAGDIANGGLPCNGCNRTGYVRPAASQYPFSEENVREFVAFLRACGGFKIF